MENLGTYIAGSIGVANIVFVGLIWFGGLRVRLKSLEDESARQRDSIDTLHGEVSEVIGYIKGRDTGAGVTDGL